MSTQAVEALKAELHDQPHNPLRPNQVQEYEEERQRLQTIVRAPSWQTGADRGAATKRYRQIEKLLREQAPKPLEGARRDKVAKLANEVLEGVIRPAMLPRAQMRRNPAGAVDQYLRRENSKTVKGATLAWKRAMRAIESENMDQDFTNVERFRPEGGNPDGTSTFMADAQLPGRFAQTPLAKENWPLGDPTAETAVGQVKKRELSEAQKANLEKMRERAAEARAAKKAAQEQSPEA